MESLKKSAEKICSFYVSDWHLVTMILPYINKELNEKANITTVLEKDIKDNIKTLVLKLNLKNEKEILKIDWKKCQGRKYTEITKKFSNLEERNGKTNIVFVNGSKDYINSVNKNIEKLLKKGGNKFKNMKFKIINCYEVTEFNGNIKEILDTHSKILNTAGEKYISEVFEGYSEVKEMC